MRKAIIILVAIVIYMCYLLHSQLNKIKELQSEIITIQAAYEEYDDTAAFERGYEYGFEEGYSQGTWEMIDYYEDYIGTDEFFNDYGFDF